MSIKLTDRQVLLISSLAYMDIDKFYQKNKKLDNYRNKTLGEFVVQVNLSVNEFENIGRKEPVEIEFNGGYTHEEFLDILEQIAKDPTLRDLRIVDYMNDNKQNQEDIQFTGFVGLALKDSDGNSIIASRGSEGTNQQRMEGTISPYTSKDWIDNYRFAGRGSEQFPLMIDFVERNRSDNGQPTFVTGHSKGAANALYAAGVLDNITGAVYDGPGITQLLTPVQVRRLRDSRIKNYVAEGDVVGALLFHEEEVVYVKTSSFVEKNGKQEYIHCYKSNSPEDKGFDLTLDVNVFKDCAHFHQLQAIIFDENDNVIQTEQGVWSYAASMLTQKLYCANLATIDIVGYGIDHLEIIKDGQIVVDNLKNVWITEEREKWERKSMEAFQELCKSHSKLCHFDYFKERLINLTELDFSKSARDALSEDSIFLTFIKSDLLWERQFDYINKINPVLWNFDEVVLCAKIATCIQERFEDWFVEKMDKMNSFLKKMNLNAKDIIADFMEFQLDTVFSDKPKEGYGYVLSFFDVVDMTFEEFKLMRQESIGYFVPMMDCSL